MHSRFRILSLFAALMLMSAASAQSYGTVRTFTIRDGLPANNISGLGQSPNGLMWIATWNGLCCYDGYQFTTFRSDSWEGADALSTNRISMIKPDSKENVWVRTYDGGLYLLDTHRCRFVNVGRLLEQKYGKVVRPRNFYTMPGGYTWVTDEQGEMNLRIDDRYATDVERIEVIDLNAIPLKGKYIRKVEADRQGREWVVTDQATAQYGHWTTTRKTADAATPAPQDTALQHRLLQLGINQEELWKHFVDRQGNIWLLSTNGLTMVSTSDDSMKWLPLVDGQQTRSLLCRRDGTVWAGSNDGYIGVYTADGRQTGWVNAQGKPSPLRSRFSDRIYTMEEDSKGYTWIGTKGQGLFVISPQGIVGHYMPDAANRYSISHANIYDVDEDEQGNIWIATYGGGLNLVRRQSDGTLQFLHSGNELKNYPLEHFSRIRRITHDGRGVILLSCTEGLVTFSNRKTRRTFYCTQHQQQDTTSLRTSDVMQTLVTRSGRIFVTTTGGGIQQLASPSLLSDSLHFRSVAAMNRGAGSVLSMAEDGQGNVWITRETEVCKYHPATGSLERFVPGHTERTIEMTEGQPAIDRQGRMWLAAIDGVLTYRTDMMHKSRFRPNIIFTRLLFQGEREPRPILNRQTLTVAKDQRNLILSFAALDYGDHYLMEYAYRMDGDKEWNYIGNTPRISFSQLQPGNHTLEVKSTNGDGVWMDNVATLYLDVTPMLWERTWVQVLLLLLVIALATWAVLTYMKYRQQSREREQRLENILRQYRELQQTITEQPTPAADPSSAAAQHAEPAVEPHRYTLEEPKIVDADQEMMQHLMAFIEERISDEDLKIEEMADAVGMSRSVFYVKVKALVGMSPLDFLRRLRMQRAEQLVSRSTMNVSEIAYAVGFTDPKYFSRCFKKETGMTPREYREKHA